MFHLDSLIKKYLVLSYYRHNNNQQTLPTLNQHDTLQQKALYTPMHPCGIYQSCPQGASFQHLHFNHTYIQTHVILNKFPFLDTPIRRFYNLTKQTLSYHHINNKTETRYVHYSNLGRSVVYCLPKTPK